MKLILISNPECFKQEALAINQLFELGLQHFHLRKPNWTLAQISELLKSIDPVYLPRIVIHDHFQIAVDWGLGGIHFSDRTKGQMEQWINYQGTQSTSSHCLDELDPLPPQIDYTFLSPIFPSISKQGYQANFDFSELSNILVSFCKAEVIALGGIQIDKVQTCSQLGFDGIAALGCIWKEDESLSKMAKRFLNLQKETDRHHRKF